METRHLARVLLLLGLTACAAPRAALAPAPRPGPSVARAGGNGAPGASFTAAPTNPAPSAAAEALLDELARPPLGSGASVTILRGDRLVTRTRGRAWDEGPAVDGATRFNVASVSKLATAARVVTLAAEGRVGLDDPIRRWLPGVVLEDAGGRDRAGEVTLRMLLAHRGGVPHQPGDLDPTKVGASWGSPDLLSRLASRWTIRLVREPGEYGYANVGYALLAAVIERVDGATYADAMAPALEQLGMATATFWPGPAAANAAKGRVEKDGALQLLAPEWYGSRYALPFTGLWTTTEDLARLGRGLVVASRDARHPLHAMTIHDAPAGHALGPVVRTRDGVRTLEHDGGGPGFLAWLVAAPERDLVVAVAVNADGEAGERARRFAAIVDAIVGEALQPAAGARAPTSGG